MNRLIPLFGVTILAASANFTPAFAGTYSLSAPDYKTASASPDNAIVSLPAGGPPAVKSDSHYDPQPVNGQSQDFKYMFSSVSLTWVANFKGETASPCSMKHDYNMSANMTSYRNDAHAGASAYGDCLPNPTSGNFHSFKTSSSTYEDEPDLHFSSVGTQSLGNYTATYSGQIMTVSALIGAKAATSAATTAGGNGGASASIKSTTTSIAFGP